MGLMKSELICPIDQHCAKWAQKYVDYCLCSTKDGFSLGLGLISVVSWVVAEIPQITTNYKQKSADGLSVVFLSTWIIGDVLNIVGCILEPSTLPTQLYTAVLYMIVTLILAFQSLYYSQIYPRLKSRRKKHEIADAVEKKDNEHETDLERQVVDDKDRWEYSPSSPISLPAFSRGSSPEDELYYRSARSLSISLTPIAGSVPPQRTAGLEAERQGLLGDDKSTQSASPKTRSLLCVAFLTMFLIGSVNIHQAETSKHAMILQHSKGLVLQVRRQLDQANGGIAQEKAQTKSWIGSFLGWGMAAIYMGGRLPQICLNIKRGNAEGLNPLMFIFALIGNATYVASILINSIDWSKLRPNLPWLVDAGGCVLLDGFILSQFLYFLYWSGKKAEKKKFSLKPEVQQLH